MRIAIYGGSFNPPHRGHMEAARAAAEALSPDRFLIIPASTPPHKALEENSPSPEQRLELCRLAFGELPGVEISDLELQRAGKSYTFDTVEALRAQYPGAELCLVMGSDMFLSFPSWYHWQELLAYCTLAVLSREDGERQALEAFKAKLETENAAHVEIISHTPLPMSSSDIRLKLRKAQEVEELKAEVYDCIIRNGLYGARPALSWLRRMVMPYLNENRVAHVLGVERQAVALAERWGEEVYSAAVAGILHDITKAMGKEKQLKLCIKYGIMLEADERETPALLHARTGAALAKERFGVPDEICDAIRWHTTGKPDMNTLEKIIYLADYTEPNRDFPGVEELRQLCFDSLDRAMALGLKMSVEEIRARGREPFHDTLDAYHWYQNLN